ncbi:thiamine pyrophosphate-binding protein [Paenibacillus rhizoplanae]
MWRWLRAGRGALNLLTGIGSCYFDSVPCLFITGQVNTYEYKFDTPVRQIGFQETDIVSVAKPLTKYAVMVTEPDQIRYELEKGCGAGAERPARSGAVRSSDESSAGRYRARRVTQLQR